MNQTKKQITEQLREMGCKTSFRTKDDAALCLEKTGWFRTFPWHDEQQMVFDAFEKMDWRELVVQGIFGNGKTTLMLGLFFYIWFHRMSAVDEIVMCAFNVCIKNELIRRLRACGIKKRPMIRTFDSMVYSVCESLGCPDLDKPNYEGRRRFLEEAFIQSDRVDIPEFVNKKWVFIDESQDLEGRCYEMIRVMFPHARVIFFGDVFQCIQKEPRTCLLWKVLNEEPEDRRVFWMKKTPRVPPMILEEIKTALSLHYPEHRSLFQQWVSLNRVESPQSVIRWRVFRSYRQIFQDSLDFIRCHGVENVMVLVFSSAITVRGGLGDVARFRNLYDTNRIPVNANYKRMEVDKLFLSTVNSSKGLERPYVFLVLTFPLELAFANFSNDLVVNLVSVGLSRCKHHVVFNVPAYKDRVSGVVSLYPSSPRAVDESATFCSRRVDKKPELSAEDGYQVLGKGVADYFEQPHSTTEVIRQGIVSYTTRLKCLENARFISIQKMFPMGDELTAWRLDFARHIGKEEHRALLGVMVEQMLCCKWKNCWPQNSELGVLDDNPMSSHCRAVYHKKSAEYFARIRKSPYTSANSSYIVKTLYLFAQCRIMTQNKVLVSFSDSVLGKINDWYSRVCPHIRAPPHAEHIRLQHNLRMPCITGIADGFMDGGWLQPKEENVMYEIKGCTKSGWHEDALFQAFLYLVMAGRCSGKIVLLNPIRNECREYRVRIPRFYSVRNDIIREAIMWNTNCFLAKNSSINRTEASQPPVLLIVRDREHGSSVFDWMGSACARLLFHGYIQKTDNDAPKNNQQTSFSEHDIQENVEKIKKWFHASHRIIEKDRTDSIQQLMQDMDYASPDPSQFSVSFDDTFVQGCIMLMHMSVFGVEKKN